MTEPEEPASSPERLVLFTGLWTLALVLGATIPVVNYWGLLLMAFTGQVDRLIRARWRRQAAIA